MEYFMTKDLKMLLQNIKDLPLFTKDC